MVERLLTQQRVALEPALLDYLADRPIDSVRNLTGVVQRVVEAAAAQDAPVTAGLAPGVLGGVPPPRRTAGARRRASVSSTAGGGTRPARVDWAYAPPPTRAT